MKDSDLYPVLNRIKLICSRFNVTIQYVTNLEVWVVHEMYIPTRLYWRYASIYDMLFGKNSMFTFSEYDISNFKERGGFTASFINVMVSLKSNTIEELNIKLDLYETGNY